MKKMIMIVAMIFGLNQIGFGQNLEIANDSLMRFEKYLGEDNINPDSLVRAIARLFIERYNDSISVIANSGKGPAGWKYSQQSDSFHPIYIKYSSDKLEVIVFDSDPTNEVYRFYYHVHNFNNKSIDSKLNYMYINENVKNRTRNDRTIILSYIDIDFSKFYPNGE